MTKKLKIGIVGAGYIAGVHAGVLAQDERVQITAVHDVVPECAERLARAHNAIAVATPLELLERCDAVFITTPNTQHVSIAIASIETGKHVFCEKPLATTVAAAESVFKKAQDGQGIFQVGHNRRFAPVYAELKRMLSETHTPHSAQVKMNRGELLKPEWTGDPAITGGFLYETPIHMFDMMRFLFGEVESLYAVASKHEYNELDDFSVLLKFTSGMHATLATAADASWFDPFERIEVFCHHATLITREMESLTYSINLEGHFTQQTMQQLPRAEKWGYMQEDRAFVDAITNGTPPLVTALDGLMSVELANAVYESVKSGTPVQVPVHSKS
ncbi:MAG TPA: Gfo/Idh/MocA family oxidoreductase [Pyrinomonadaceae bacterium]|nr:Gfo/Idh/MocA family oxidoreductase [Pyrinomonadaceae bacterium]